MKPLTETEKLALLGLTIYPQLSDKEVAQRLSMLYSTLASAKARLLKRGYLEEYVLPIFPKLGFELMATVYTDFNPAITVEERVAITRKMVEVYPEMVLSLGEAHRGFSLSVAQNVTRIMRISLQRVRLFADLNLLEIELPIEVLLPFELSIFHRYFNMAPLLSRWFKGTSSVDPYAEFGISRSEIMGNDSVLEVVVDRNENAEDLSKTEKEILYYLVKYPFMSSAKLSGRAPYSRQTISKVKDSLIQGGFIRMQRIPDLSVLGFSMLTLYHARIDPKRPLDGPTCKSHEILQDETVFLVSRPTELLMLAVYEDYGHYNRGMGAFTQCLKSNGYASKIPNIRSHSLQHAIWIKKFQYHDLIKDTFSLKVG
jgi:hypothetical protein